MTNLLIYVLHLIIKGSPSYKPCWHTRSTLPRHCFINLICYICNNEAKSINLKLELETTWCEKNLTNEGQKESRSGSRKGGHMTEAIKLLGKQHEFAGKQERA